MKPKRVLYVDFYSFVGGGQQNLLSVFKAMDRQRYTPLLAIPPVRDRLARPGRAGL